MTVALQPLLDWLAAHPDPDEVVAAMGGGDVRTRGDGTRVITIPWAAYTPTMATFWAALVGVEGWTVDATRNYLDVTEQWFDLHGARTVVAADLAVMDRFTLLNFLRWIDRGERFCEGHWQGCFRGGLMHAAARALLASG